MSDYAQRVKALSEVVEQLGPNSEAGNSDPPEWVLAVDLTDIEEECVALSRRIAALRSGDIEQWHEIRESIVHLLYHLRSPELVDLAERVDR